MNFETKRLRLLTHLTSYWAGERLDSGGLVRILNQSGKRPPLVWCFNSEKEFPLLAAGLGADQPVIGVRSLHLVEPRDDARYRKDERTADTYSEALLSWPGLDECSVGGNCQGAGIAFHVASNLLKAGKKIRALIIMEADSPMPFPGSVGLIFGDRSDMFNPFLLGLSPQTRWNAMFAKSQVEIVPGSHGEYFDDENRPALCNAITTLISKPDGENVATAPAVEIDLEVVDTLPVMKAGEMSPFEIRSTSKRVGERHEIGQVVLCFQWISTEHGPLDRVDIRPFTARLDGVDTTTAVVETPSKPGEWDLHIFPCLELGGPISWAANFDRKCVLHIE